MYLGKADDCVPPYIGICTQVVAFALFSGLLTLLHQYLPFLNAHVLGFGLSHLYQYFSLELESMALTFGLANCHL